jgi:hypothetical protein
MKELESESEVSKIEESELELLCTNSTALVITLCYMQEHWQEFFSKGMHIT